MSQTDNNNPLNEEEIREYINGSYDLNLPKEAFFKPSKDMLVRVYSTFMDEFCPGWSDEVKNEDELMLIIALEQNMQSFFEAYDTIDFTLNDILLPDRKRTCLTLNLLIYLRLQLTEVLKPLMNSELERAIAMKQEMEQLVQIEQEAKLELEELAIEEGSLDNDDDARNIEELRKEFDNLKTQGDKLFAQKNQIKEKIKKSTARIEKLKNESESKKASIAKLVTLDTAWLKFESAIKDTTKSHQDILKMCEESKDIIESLRGEKVTNNKTFDLNELISRQVLNLSVDTFSAQVAVWERNVKLTLIEEEETKKQKEFGERMQKLKIECLNLEKKKLEAKLDYENAENDFKIKKSECLNKLTHTRQQISNNIARLKEEYNLKAKKLDFVVIEERQRLKNVEEEALNSINSMEHRFNKEYDKAKILYNKAIVLCN